MRFEGAIKSWNNERGFGFIEPAQGGQEIFVHVTALKRRSGPPQINQPVTFEIEPGPQGKKRARDVELMRIAHRAAKKGVDRKSPVQWGPSTLFAIPAFLALYLAASALWRPPLWIAGIYLLGSVVTFMAYAADKAAAARGGWRTPETTLHTLALVGGWPGALLAQQFLRHKSAKAEFRAVFWGTVVLNMVGFMLLCSTVGRARWGLS